MSDIEINKYNNGKIYKIWNIVNDDIYVGSTCNPLCKRMAYHRSHYNNEKYKHRNLYKLMNEIGTDMFHIELVEEYPCENKEQLRKREGQFIRELGTLNMVIEDRTREEYKAENKEKIKEYMVKYREDKKDQILEKTKEYRENNKDKIKQYKIDNKETILAKNKEYYQRTKEHKQEYQKSEKVKQWKNTKVECPCGGSYTNCHKAAHFKTAKHKAYEESIKDA